MGWLTFSQGNKRVWINAEFIASMLVCSKDGFENIQINTELGARYEYKIDKETAEFLKESPNLINGLLEILSRENKVYDLERLIAKIKR